MTQHTPGPWAVREHNAALAAAQRNEKLWRAEWEQISETARVLQEKLAAERERCAKVAGEWQSKCFTQSEKETCTDIAAAIRNLP